MTNPGPQHPLDKNMLDLRRLRYFVAVAKELHFGRAAEHLHVAQPPLTRQIGLLETELGFQLFRRTSRTVELTEEGHRFLPYARSALQHGLRAEEFAHRISNGADNNLVFGYSPSVSLAEQFCTSLKVVCRHYPKVDLTLVESPSKKLNEDVANGKIDVAVSRLRPDSLESDLIVEHATREQLLVAVASDDSLAGALSVRPTALRDRQIIIVDTGPASGLNAQLRSKFAEWDLELRARLVAPHFTSMFALVAAGLGVSLVPETAALIRNGVRYLSIADDLGYAEAYLIRRAGGICGQRGQIIEIFVDAMSSQPSYSTSASAQPLIVPTTV